MKSEIEGEVQSTQVIISTGIAVSSGGLLVESIKIEELLVRGLLLQVLDVLGGLVKLILQNRDGMRDEALGDTRRAGIISGLPRARLTLIKPVMNFN